MTPPSTNGSNRGRDAGGRFARGNPGGPGNPHAQKVAQLRSTLFRAVSTTDLREVIKRLVTEAKGGDTAATRLLLNYVLGEPQPYDFLERLEQLEAALAGLKR